MAPFQVSSAHKGLINHYCLYYLLISPLPYLSISFLSPGISSPFPSQFWVLFLPRLSSAGSSSSPPLPTSQSLSWFPTMLSFWLGSMLTQIYLYPALPSLRSRFPLSCPHLPGQGAVHGSWKEELMSTSHQYSRALSLETQGGNACHASYLVESRNVSV